MGRLNVTFWATTGLGNSSHLLIQSDLKLIGRSRSHVVETITPESYWLLLLSFMSISHQKRKRKLLED